MKWIRRAVAVVLVVLVTLLAVRIYDTQRGAPLGPWHIYVPEELDSGELDRADWAGYLANEERIFASLRSEVTGRLDASERSLANRYFEGSPLHSSRLSRDWNRSFVLAPEGEPAGAVVLLHGLTDSPYSMRHVAGFYRERGFAAVAIRMPGHGTVPAGLTEARWEDWLAATRLAMREARRLAGLGKPLHVVGYSNGGALALKYALDALENTSLPQVDRVVLMSPMIGVTAFARFAGLAGLPAFFPAFAKAAWLSVLPEFNPFKYNSFPVNAARQSFRLTQALQAQIVAHERNGVLEGLPSILTFQSAMDSTVSTSAIVSALYRRLPGNGSELVLFDINRTAKLGPLLRPTSETMLARILPTTPRTYRTTIITNAGPERDDVVERMVQAGSDLEAVRELGLAYPHDIYSLSHIAIPFPPSDGLYGFQPDEAENFGVRLGTLASRGESGVLVVNLDTLLRISSNPFYAYLGERLAETLPARRARPPQP